jgi:hypothetical protein
MVDTKINLVEKREINPYVAVWRKRLNIVLAVTAFVFFIGVGTFFALRATLLSSSKRIQERKNMLMESVKNKKKVEGIYLTLLLRLKAIESIEKKSLHIENLPKVVDELVAGNAVVDSVEADSKGVTVEFTANSPEIVENIIERIKNYRGEYFSFANLVAEKTQIGKDGKYSITLKLGLSKDKYGRKKS